jgi:hypothetical protein
MEIVHNFLCAARSLAGDGVDDDFHSTFRIRSLSCLVGESENSSDASRRRENFPTMSDSLRASTSSQVVAHRTRRKINRETHKFTQLN